MEVGRVLYSRCRCVNRNVETTTDRAPRRSYKEKNISWRLPAVIGKQRGQRDGGILPDTPISTLRIGNESVLGGKVSMGTIRRCLKRNGLSFKTASRAFPGPKTDKVANLLLQFSGVSKEFWKNPHVASINEISFHNNGFRTHGWSKIRERCQIASPATRGVRYSAICASSCMVYIRTKSAVGLHHPMASYNIFRG